LGVSGRNSGGKRNEGKKLFFHVITIDAGKFAQHALEICRRITTKDFHEDLSQATNGISYTKTQVCKRAFFICIVVIIRNSLKIYWKSALT
jgi:hypothetical protein